MSHSDSSLNSLRSFPLFTCQQYCLIKWWIQKSASYPRFPLVHCWQYQVVKNTTNTNKTASKLLDRKNFDMSPWFPTVHCTLRLAPTFRQVSPPAAVCRLEPAPLTPHSTRRPQLGEDFSVNIVMMRQIIISNYYSEIEILKGCQTLHDSREELGQALMLDAPF